MPSVRRTLPAVVLADETRSDSASMGKTPRERAAAPRNKTPDHQVEITPRNGNM